MIGEPVYAIGNPFRLRRHHDPRHRVGRSIRTLDVSAK